MTSVLSELPVVHNKEGWPWNVAVDPTVYAVDYQWPKISIVTPSYNQGKYIEETIRSVLLQNYPNLEYIIIDGGSTDETIDIIKKYEPWLTHWESKKDDGQADAINKGIFYCTGDIFNWINSDDVLADSSLLEIGSIFRKGTTVAGKVYNFYSDSARNSYTQNKNLDAYNFLNLTSTFHQPGIWCDLSKVKQAGCFPRQYSYYFDRVFFMKYFLDNDDIIYTSKKLVCFRFHDDSKTNLIMSNKIDELIDNYYISINNTLFYKYKKVLKYALLNQLLPEKHILQWENKWQNNVSIRRVFSYINLGLSNVFLLRTRFFFIYLKKQIRISFFK